MQWNAILWYVDIACCICLLHFIAQGYPCHCDSLVQHREGCIKNVSDWTKSQNEHTIFCFVWVDGWGLTTRSVLVPDSAKGHVYKTRLVRAERTIEFGTSNRQQLLFTVCTQRQSWYYKLNCERVFLWALCEFISFFSFCLQFWRLIDITRFDATLYA